MKREGGFILVDTIVALTVVSLMLVSLLTVWQLIHKASFVKAQDLEARLIARAISSHDSCPNSSGQVARDATNFEWTCSSQIDEFRERSMLRRKSIRVSVIWNGRTSENAFVLERKFLQARQP